MENIAYYDGYYGGGGAIYFSCMKSKSSNCSLSIIDSEFDNNWASFGGAINYESAIPMLENNQFGSLNTAYYGPNISSYGNYLRVYYVKEGKDQF